MSPDGNLASLGDNLPSNALLSPNNPEDREMIRRLNLAEAERLGIPIDVPLSELDADGLGAYLCDAFEKVALSLRTDIFKNPMIISSLKPLKYFF